MEVKEKNFGISPSSNIPVDQFKYLEATETKNLGRAHGKGVFVTLSGSLMGTFGAGVATMKAGGILKNILSGIQVKDAKGDLVITTVGAARFHSRRMNGKEAPSLYQQNSVSLTAPTVGLYSGNFTTAQPVAIQESIYIPFECEIAEANFLDTLLRYNGRDVNTIKLVLEKLSNLLDPASTAVVAWTNNLVFDINLMTAEHSGPAHRWVRSYKEESVSAATPKRSVDISGVENLAGLMFEVTQGSGAVRTPINFAQAQQIVVNVIGKERSTGRTVVIRQDETLASLAYNDLSKKKIDSLVDGYTYLNLINGNMLASALPNNFSEIMVNFNLPSTLSFASPYNVRVYIDDIDLA